MYAMLSMTLQNYLFHCPSYVPELVKLLFISSPFMSARVKLPCSNPKQKQTASSPWGKSFQTCCCGQQTLFLKLLLLKPLCDLQEHEGKPEGCKAFRGTQASSLDLIKENYKIKLRSEENWTAYRKFYSFKIKQKQLFWALVMPSTFSFFKLKNSHWYESFIFFFSLLTAWTQNSKTV